MAPRRDAAVALACACALAAVAPAAYAQVRAAVLDVQRALRETDEGRHAMAALRALYTARQRELDARQAALLRVRHEVELRRSAGDALGADRMAAALERDLARLREDFAAYQAEIQRREAEATAPMMAKLQAVARDVQARGRYDVIVDQSGIVARDPTKQMDDVTERVVQEYNRRHPVAPAARDGGRAGP